jgi:hypothetical protein
MLMNMKKMREEDEQMERKTLVDDDVLLDLVYP